MTVNNAYLKLARKISGVRVVRCCEYDSVFVFQLAPISVKSSSRILSGTMSVDKKTGAVKAFKPFDIPIDEYRRGKEITMTVGGVI